MRPLSSLLLLCLIGEISPTARPEDNAPRPRPLLDRAIAARGDADKQAKFVAFQAKGKGELFFQPMTWEVSAQLPTCKRSVLMRKEKADQILLVNGDAGWVKAGDKVEPLSKDQVVEEQISLYAALVYLLVPLKEKNYTVKETGEKRMRIPGRDGLVDTLGLCVAHAGRPDIHLYLDKTSLEVVKLKAPIPGGTRDLWAQMYFSDYRPTNGVRIPWKCSLWFEGVPILDLHLQEITPLENLDKEAFEKL